MKDNGRKLFHLVCVCVWVNNKVINPHFLGLCRERAFCGSNSRFYYCPYHLLRLSAIHFYGSMLENSWSTANLIMIVINEVKFLKKLHHQQRIIRMYMRLCITFSQQLMFNSMLMNKIRDFKWLANESSGSDASLTHIKAEKYFSFLINEYLHKFKNFNLIHIQKPGSSTRWEKWERIFPSFSTHIKKNRKMKNSLEKISIT